MAIGRRDIPVIDSHIHLYPGSESHSIAWLTPDSSLNGQWSVDQYRNATKATNSLQGFVVVEAGRKHDLDSGQCDGSGWSGPLQEVSWLCRVALGEPRPGEGHGIQDSKLCLAIIPWAPIPSGPAVLERYLGRVKEVSGSVWPKIRGFRYLLQDKPCGTSRKKDFVESLKLLARGGLLFEICVDQHRRGHSQLHDAVALLQLSTAGVTHSNLATVVIGKLDAPGISLQLTH